MMSIACPLCSVSLDPSSLEAHLRFELTFPSVRCELCERSFCGEEDAAQHFQGPLAKHPGVKPQLLQVPADPAKKARLLELLRLARGGGEAVQERLCVCGRCRLLCREDFRNTTGQGSRDSRPTSLPHRHGSRDSFVQRAQAPGRTDAEPALMVQGGQVSAQPDVKPALHANQASLNQDYDSQMPVEVEPDVATPNEIGEHEIEEETAIKYSDVKPNMEDLKAAISSDGKVSCLQCGHRIDKCNFTSHVRSKHMPGSPFQCLLCPVNAKLRKEMNRHQKTVHGTELTPDTFTDSSPMEVVRDWVTLCFGETTNVKNEGFTCRPCDRRIGRTHVKTHVSIAHLKKTLFKCKKCPFESQSTDQSRINRHVKEVHKLKAGPETIDSSAMEQYAPILKAMIAQLFEK